MFRRIILVVILLAAGACQPMDVARFDPSQTLRLPTGQKQITVSWAANVEPDVNSPGGGYIVYAWTSSGFDPSTAPSFSVPYDSGLGSTPTSTVIPNLASGTYYIRVAAYSAFNPLSLSGGNRSVPSSETSVVVP